MLNINKKIALSSITVVAALSLVSGSAFALFSSSATSQNNTFSTGNASLQIASGDGTQTPTSDFGSTIPAPSVNETGIGPNFAKDYFFWLKNSSTSTIDLGLTGTFTDIHTSGNTDIANQMLSTIDCGTPTGPFTVNQWGGNPSVNLSKTLAPGDQVQCKMTMNLANVDNTYQNSSVRFDGVFTGTQTP